MVAWKCQISLTTNFINFCFVTTEIQVATIWKIKGEK